MTLLRVVEPGPGRHGHHTRLSAHVHPAKADLAGAQEARPSICQLAISHVKDGTEENARLKTDVDKEGWMYFVDGSIVHRNHAEGSRRCGESLDREGLETVLKVKRKDSDGRVFAADSL